MPFVRNRENLLGIHDELDEILLDFAFLSSFYRDFHPANAGDVSQILSVGLGNLLINRFKNTLSNWFQIKRIEGVTLP